MILLLKICLIFGQKKSVFIDPSDMLETILVR